MISAVGQDDPGGIPSQFPIHEDTLFQHILQDSLDFFGIEENQQNCYFLVDTKTSELIIICPDKCDYPHCVLTSLLIMFFLQIQCI